jgi:HEAT repeat protein
VTFDTLDLEEVRPMIESQTAKAAERIAGVLAPLSPPERERALALARAKLGMHEPLGRYQGKYVEEWLDDLVSHDGGVRTKAVEIVKELGPRADAAIDVIVGRLREHLTNERWKGLMPAEALLQIERNVDEAGGLVVDCLCDEGSGDVRLTALGSICKNGPSAAPLVPRLVRVLRESGRGEVRALAAEALGGIGRAAEEALSQLRLASTDGDAAVREAALKAIERIEVKGSTS